MPAEAKVKNYPAIDCTLIGKRVREARKSSHMTQEDLAENAHAHRRIYAIWKTEKSSYL